MNQQESSDSSIVAMQKLHRWRMAFFGLVILLAGVVIGATLTLLLTHRIDRPHIPPPPEFAAEQMVGRLDRQLNLSDEQMKQLEPILRKHMQKLNDIRMEARPRITEQLRLMNEEISSVLNEDQRQLWQRHLQRLQADLRQRPRRRRAGPEPRQPDRQRAPRPGRERFGPPPPEVPNEPPPLEPEQF